MLSGALGFVVTPSSGGVVGEAWVTVPSLGATMSMIELAEALLENTSNCRNIARQSARRVRRSASTR